MDWGKTKHFAGICLAVIFAVSLGAFAEVSFNAGGSGEVIWWTEYLDDQFNGGSPALCSPEDMGVELSAYNSGDWAAVLLDCAIRFELAHMTQPPEIEYRHMNPFNNPYTADSGPRVVLLLETTGLSPREYLAVSDPAPEFDRTCSTKHIPTRWWYAEWDGAIPSTADFDSYFDYGAEIAPGASGTFSDLQNDPALAGAKVRAVGALMGVADTGGDGKTMSGDDFIGTGTALIHTIEIRWMKDTGFGSVVDYGGVYNLEQPWPDVVTFEPVAPPPPADAVDFFDLWTKSSLWNRIHVSDLENEANFVHDFPSPPGTTQASNYAIYFGSADPNTKLGSYDVTGSLVRGDFVSPLNIVNPGDEYLTIEFDSFREVELYDDEFDRTYVQIRFDGSAWANTAHDYWQDEIGQSPWDENPWAVDDQGAGWKTIWYKDSSHESGTAWEHVVCDLYPDSDGDPDDSFQISIPSDATTIWVRFMFDSEDGYNNDYIGWIVDNVIKTHNPTPTENRITTEALPQAQIGVNYLGYLDANQVVSRWDLLLVEKQDPTTGEYTTLSGLPERLALQHNDGTGRGVMWGVPEPGTAGTYRVTIEATFRDGRPVTAEKVFHLAIRPEAGTPNQVHMEDFTNALGWKVDGINFGPAGSCPNLWHEAAASAIDIPDPSAQYGDVAYFGKDESGNRDDANYACTRAKGYLTSPPYAIPADLAGERITVGFKSWREVEFYDGEYDQTWVEVRFEGEDWSDPIWYKDSSDPSTAEWMWEEIVTDLIVPDPNTRKIQIRFGFDSIDGYNNDTVGWAIDEVTIYAGSSDLSIDTPCPLPETAVGHYYKVELEWSGGPSTPRREFEIVDGTLPPGIGDPFEDITDGSWWIEGVARESGTFNFTIRLTLRNSLGQKVQSVEKICEIQVGSQVVLLYEDFEDDPYWNWGALWHRTDDAGVKTVDDLGPNNHAAYYGIAAFDQSDPSYNTGGRTTGTLMLTMPVIDLKEAPDGSGRVQAVKVYFDYWREVEFFNNKYDYTKVQVKLDDGEWISIWEKNSTHESAREWLTEEDVPAFLTGGADEMLIRFAFDSIDGWYNHYVGWLVDNIKVEMTDTAGAISLDAFGFGPMSISGRDVQEISVMNTPNPVRDVHTTTFTVRAVGVEAMRVEIYDLDQNLVFEEEVAGNEIEYHTTDKYGGYLANGVYFYRAIVLINDIWHETTFQKLIILR